MQLSDVEKRLLMVLQYEFNYDSDNPFEEAARKLGISVEHVVKILRDLKARGILKRVGFYVNPRGFRRNVALIAFQGGDVEAFRKICVEDDEVTHCYLRDHPEWRVWIVRRGSSLDELLRWATLAADAAHAERFEILPSRRLYRLSVKYDLDRGVSRAGPFTLVKLNPPSPNEVGLSEQLVKELRALPLTPNPYATLASRHGLSVDELVEGIVRGLKAGLLGDPGAVLDGKKLGFNHNAMIVTRGCHCGEAARLVPEATHVVERIVYPPDARASWAPACYMVVHAVKRELIDEVVEKLRSIADNVTPLFSLEDLKPEAER